MHRLLVHQSAQEALEFQREELSVRPTTYAVINASSGLILAVLLVAGYPPWRIAVFSAALALALVVHGAVWALRAQLRARPTHPLHLVTLLAWQATLLVQVGVVGGIRGPVFPRLGVALGVSVALFGVTMRGQKLTAGVLLAAMLLFPFAPESWTGPGLPAPHHWTALYVVGGAGIATAMIELSAVRRVAEISFAAASAAREEVVERALKRTRDLELLSGRISHELRNPLSAIKTLAQASFRAVSDAETRMHLEVIENEAKRIEDALQGHLSFARPIEKCVPTAVQLGELADDTIGLLRGRCATAGVQIRRKGDALAEVDPRRVRDALLNLLVNALEACSPGGEIAVEIASTHHGATVRISDTGRGMSAEVLGRLGTPYFTTRDSGNGLGVALARATFEQHGGSLEFESVPGAGTTAIATVPARAAMGA